MRRVGALDGPLPSFARLMTTPAPLALTEEDAWQHLRLRNLVANVG
jgi:hypothetical protein